MSKLIVEMELPKRCIKCGVRLKCKLYVCGLQQDIAENLKPLIGDKDCLIKGVLPDEHGRLVDADACSSVLRKLEREANTNTKKLCYGYAAKMFEEAFAIIAAERKDDGNI
jgi:hypothetical protein